MGTLREFLIRIKLLLTGRGAEEAKESLDGMSQSAREASGELEQSAEASDKAGSAADRSAGRWERFRVSAKNPNDVR